MAGAAVETAFRSEIVDEIDQTLALACAGADLTVLDNDTLSGVVLGLERAQARLDALRAHAAAELDVRGATIDEWGLRTGNWIAARTHIPTNSAKRRVHVSSRLRNEFPVLLDALADGRVSWWHADVFCRAANPRIADLLAWLLPELIELAAALPHAGWCAELRRVASRLDLDGGHDPSHDVEENQLHLHRTFDGTHELHGRLVGAWGASLAEMLERATDRQHRLHQQIADSTNGETPIPSRPTLRALALLDLCQRGTAIDLTTTHAPTTDLTLTHHHGADGCNREYTTLTGQTLTDTDLGCRLCDPAIHLLRLDGNDIPLDLQRTQRFATPDQKRALAARDRHCRFPGCDCPTTWCDTHHIIRYTDGGLSNLDNYATLCRFHHGITHRHGWTLVADDDGTLTWTTPRGHTLRSPVPDTRAGPHLRC